MIIPWQTHHGTTEALKEELCNADEAVAEAVLDTMPDEDLVFLFSTMQDSKLIAPRNIYEKSKYNPA